MGTTSVDPHALWLAAQRLDEAADMLQSAIADRCVDSAKLDRLLAGARLWQQTARETSEALRSAAARYSAAEVAAAEALR